MATSRQKKANRKNAKRSTGPRTAEGKARSSQNASKHGLFARDTVLPDENPQEFLGLITELEKELNAVGGFEHRLVRHIADAEWRIRRIIRLENGVLTRQLEAERLRVRRIQADLGNLLPPKQTLPPAAAQQGSPPASTGQGSPPDVAQALSLPSRHSSRLLPDSPTATAPAAPRPLLPGAYQQTTLELGSAIDQYGVGPTLSTLSLYESRLNRKYQSLLKQLHLTQKIRLARAAEHCETAIPHYENAEPGHESAEPPCESEPRLESQEPQPLPAETEVPVAAAADTTLPPQPQSPVEASFAKASAPSPGQSAARATEPANFPAPTIAAQPRKNPTADATRSVLPETRKQPPENPAADVA